MSLRARILLLVLLATLLPALILAVYFFNQRDNNIIEAKQRLDALAKYAVENLDDKVKGTVQMLHGLSRAQDIEIADKALCSDFLASVLARYPQYTGLLTISAEGDLHCDSLRSGRVLNVKSRDYFKQALATGQPAYDVVIGGLTGIAVLQVAYPALDQQGRLSYMVLASLNLSQYAQAFTAASPYPDTRMLIWDKKGKLLVGTPANQRNLSPEAARTANALFRFASTPGEQSSLSSSGLDRVRTVWARAAMPAISNGGAYLLLGIPEETLIAKANRRLYNALALLLVVALVTFVIAWYAAESGIRRHVRSIARVAGSIETANLEARCGPPYPSGELGELMAVVDRAAGAVQRQQTEIDTKARDLQKVNRTLLVISGISTLIARVDGREELFHEACRIAVQAGGFRMALISLFDPDLMRVIPMASAGKDEVLLNAIKEILSSPERAPSSMIETAMRQKRAVVSNDASTDSKVLLSGQYLEAGVRSIAVLPLLVAGEAVGTLALYAGEPNFFLADEMALLTELASTIAFAIDHIDKGERLEHLAYYDALTGLANRSLFIERVAQFMRSAVSSKYTLALLLFDLERFKNINDSLGRAAGDTLLKQVAEWLSRERGDANLFARIDADRFAIVLPDVSLRDDMTQYIEDTLAALLEHPFRLNDAVFRIAAKAGVALFPDDGADADTLFKNAEAALKNAKRSGERYLFYSYAMNERVADKLTMENQLRQALENREFVLHYQPKVALASGKLASAEALLRWNNPRVGLVPPGQFIPILEETGLISQVGAWALQQAIADYLRWFHMGLPAVRIAVNVSPIQLRNRDFVSEIKQAVAVDPQAAQGLELEITENLIMADINHSILSLREIRASGVTIAIDDFGTGFSSLAYLSKLPVDTLKIDRSFIEEMTSGSEGLALVSTIISLAHALKHNVVAEGVETDEQARLLRLLNCDEMQGFLFSKAVPVDVFETKFLRPFGSD